MGRSGNLPNEELRIFKDWGGAARKFGERISIPYAQMIEGIIDKEKHSQEVVIHL